MTWLWKFLFCPIVLRMGGDGGGSGGGGGNNAAAEESRKADLRKRIDKLYGISDEKTPIYGPKPAASPVTSVFDAGNGIDPGWSTTGGEEGVAPIIGYEDDPEAAGARAAMEGENTKLADATRSYQTDQLGRQYTKAERDTRFKLARQGLLGGSEDIFQQGEVTSDRDLGATRVDDAVRRAVSQLKTQREDERLKAVQLVNSGAGDSAVSSAQAGLRNTFDTAANAQKANLFQDLFANSADVVTANNAGAQQAALLGRYRDRLSTFFPTSGTTGGRVTAT